MAIVRFASLAVGLFLAMPALAVAPTGPETAVASPGDFMFQPVVDASRNGSYVVAWAQQTLPNGSSDVYARRYAVNGAPLGAAFRVNTYLPGYQNRPAVAMNEETGDFVVVWQSGVVGSQDGTQDGSDDGVYGQLYYGDGTPRGGEFRVNTRTAGDQSQPAVSMDPTGAFTVAWAGDTNGGREIFFQRYAADSAPQGKETVVSNLVPGDAETPAISAQINGFVVAWANRLAVDGGSPDPGLLGLVLGAAWQDLYTINKRRYNQNGMALEVGAVVSSSLRNALGPKAPRLLAPRVTFDGVHCWVAWQRGDVLNSGDISIEVQQYRSNNLRFGERVRIAEPGTELMAPALASGGAGSLIMLAWQRRVPGSPADSDIYTQNFPNGIDPQDPPQRVNQTTAGNQATPALPHINNFYSIPVVWQGPGNDAAASVYFRLFGYSF